MDTAILLAVPTMIGRGVQRVHDQRTRKWTTLRIGGVRSHFLIATLRENRDRSPPKSVEVSAWFYFGMGRTIVAFSFSETSPSLPSIRYLIFNCFAIPEAGSPPKLWL